MRAIKLPPPSDQRGEAKKPFAVDVLELIKDAPPAKPVPKPNQRTKPILWTWEPNLSIRFVDSRDHTSATIRFKDKEEHINGGRPRSEILEVTYATLRSMGVPTQAVNDIAEFFRRSDELTKLQNIKPIMGISVYVL